MKGVPSLIELDEMLLPYRAIIDRRIKKREEVLSFIEERWGSLVDFASSHLYFGLHKETDRWVFREWAPRAREVYLIGDMTGWQEKEEFALAPAGNGVWEIYLPLDSISHGHHYKLRIKWDGGEGERIPSHATYVVQDPSTGIFSARVWDVPPFRWRYPRCESPPLPLLIYEAHVGMAQEEERVGTYVEFTRRVLPRIRDAGYNTLQLMAIQEHPYYGSFGYQVTNFFAPSSRFGTPDELRELIDTAHGMGMYVVMDIVHSHAAINEVEGLSCFDGSYDLYFHSGERGVHPLWGSRCFDYGKIEVIRFLLSNLRYFMEEFHIDGFRFDGVTSMIYLHHGIGMDFLEYGQYFGDDVDEDALVYLSLANNLIHELSNNAISVAEEVSGMPGLAYPVEGGGYGFDYRFAMGIPDMWIRLVKDKRDEDWSMGEIWYELTNHRKEEKTISYVESHDQALVGDQSMIFRLIGRDMYFFMRKGDENLKVDRGIALHKMIRFITITTACAGYLNFMGNEFGHPEWIDFPREGNNWSYKYARRQWHLADSPELRYGELLAFDRDMLGFVKSYKIITPSHPPHLLYLHEEDKVIVFLRRGFVFVFNFHPSTSFVDYKVPSPPGTYTLIFSSDREEYGGFERISLGEIHHALPWASEGHHLSLYLPARCCFALSPPLHPGTGQGPYGLEKL